MDLMLPPTSGSSIALGPKVDFGNDSIRGDLTPLPGQLLEAEESFYSQYPWTLNPFITVAEAISHLRMELDKFENQLGEWQRAEVRTNIFFLSCGILNAVDDYLHGGRSSFSKALSLFRAGKLLVRAGRSLPRPFRTIPRRRAGQWQERWKSAIDEFLQIHLAGPQASEQELAHCLDRMKAVLSTKFPNRLEQQLIRVPTPFRGQDLTPIDVITLGQKWLANHPDSQRPVIVVGLRTSGSYFAPLLRAYLCTEGFHDVEWITLRPKEGTARHESACLRNRAKAGFHAILVDDAPNTGDSVAAVAEILIREGFNHGRISALLPVHHASRGRKNRPQAFSTSPIQVCQLPPEEWHKRQLLAPEVIEKRLQEYFGARHYSEVRLGESGFVKKLNTQLQQFADEKRGTSLKRVYEVHLRSREGVNETRYVLAKSVGWGWLAYHAFLAGSRLQQFVPPMLGLRDGILFTEWLNPTSSFGPEERDRELLIRSTASYVAARARLLSLERDPTADLRRDGQHPGLDLWARALGQAYGSYTAGELERHGIQLALSRRSCTYPTLIDAKMRRVDFIKSPSGFLKTDFEHHGFGKHELNVVDPAYDLAEAILHLGLSTSEESRLLEAYKEQCPDAEIEERLFLNKFLAGTAALGQALRNLNHQSLAHRQQQHHQDYLAAWNFLTWQTAYFCGRFCRRPGLREWRPRLAVLAVDGVLDRRIFGFPSTTAAGIQALSLLHGHDFSIVLNTARSVADVKTYCEAYGLAGGIAEYGSYVWDAIHNRGRVQVSAEALHQLEQVRSALRQIPGIFLDDAYHFSVRAFTYEEQRPTPIPTALAWRVLADVKADRLRLQQNSIDTAIMAQEVDKGTGLLALLDWAGQPDAETFAIGDSSPDLAMFRVASRSFAPTRMKCRRELKELKCQTSRRLYQPGLLGIVRSLIHPDGQRCQRCYSCEPLLNGDTHPVLKFFEVADSSRFYLRLRSVVDFLAFQLFGKK